MRLARDKRLHLALGLAIALVLLGLIVLAAHAGIPVAIAAGAVAAGGGYEGVQRLRGEGTPSWGDAAATAVPGLVLAVVLHLVLRP